MHNYKKIFLLITNLYLFLFGLSWIILHVYLRLIKERNSYTLLEFKEIDINHIRLIEIIIIINLIIIIISFYKLYIIYVKNLINERNMIIQILTWFFDFIYWKPLEFIREKFISNIPYSGDIYYKFAQFLDAYQPMKNTFLFSAIIFNYLPRIIIAISLMIDIYVYKQVHYFFISLSLIIISLFYQTIIKIFIVFSTDGEAIIGQIVLEVPSSIKIQHYSYYKKSGYEYLTYEEFRTYVDAYKIFSNLKIYSEAFNLYCYKYLPFVNIICSFIFILSWLQYLHLLLEFTILYDLLINDFLLIKAVGLNFNFSPMIEDPFSGIFLTDL